MGYLQPTEYENYGLACDTTDDWVTAASALIDGHCRRASLIPLQYMERMRLVEGSRTVRLSYLPMVAVAPANSPLIAVRARYARGRRGEVQFAWQQQIAGVFGLPGSWIDLDCSTVDWVAETGELVLPQSLLGMVFNEVEATYTAGLTVIPDGVKAACALIVKNAQSMPALNVKRSRLDTLEMEYFSNSLVDNVVKTLLRPYVANRLG